MADYTIEFCPNNGDYVGTEQPGEQYKDATATCSFMATMGTQTYKVGPSPTKTATKGTLQVVATVAPLLDGAAAIFDPNGGSVISTSSAARSTQVLPSPSPSGNAADASRTTSQLVTNTVTTTAIVTGTDGQTTKVFTTIQGSTLLEIVNGQTVRPGPTAQVNLNDEEDQQRWRHKGHKGKCKGGQFLRPVPHGHHQQKKKVSHVPRAYLSLL